ncbi:MAG: SRPBCC family protein [Anaerolineae bacterium]
MIIEDKFEISAPIQQVWDFLLDIPSVSRCIPGAQEVEQVDEQTFNGSLVVKVGPIKANFSGKAILAEVEPPRRIIARAEAKDKSTASMVSAAFTAVLTEITSSQTEIAYQVDVAIRGRLGQFGQGVIRETAKQVTQAFAECLQARLAEQMAAAAPPPEPPQRDGSPMSTPTTAPAAPRPQASPSLLSILLKAVMASINNWFRAILPGSRKPVD